MLLKTRFYIPPVRENSVVRQRLMQTLSEAAGGSLIVVSAPAGYGKTTLVSQWLHHKPHQFAWLTLGREHNAEDVFWRYTITSIQKIQPQVGARALSLLEQLGDNPLSNIYHECLVSFLNDLDDLAAMNNVEGALTLVLDDFHFLKNPQLISWFNLLLDHLPSTLRVIVTSRDLPDLNLPRRRASGQLIPLTADDIRFTEQECFEFFHRVVHWEGDELVPFGFYRKTEGWVAGLQLVALSLNQAHANMLHLLEDSYLDRHISDYLFEEVFHVQSLELQQFLMLSAAPKRFCAGLSNALTGKSNSYSLLSQLETSDLFIVPLDNHRTWYRYHDLFRQFLLQRARFQPPEIHNTALEAALKWLEENSYYEDAIELCLEFQLWNEAYRLLNSEYLLQQHNALSPQRTYWLQQLPGEFLAEDSRSALEIAEDDAGLSSDFHNGVEALTRRERAVLERIGKGLSNKEIANELNVSLNTLKVHIRNLYGKMGVENRTQVLLKLNS